MIGTLSDSIECILAEGLDNVGRKPCKLCNSRGDSLPQAVFTLPSSVHHRFFRNQDSLVVCSPHNVVYENGHTFAQPHFVTGLLAKMFHWQCLNHMAVHAISKQEISCETKGVFSHRVEWSSMRRSNVNRSEHLVGNSPTDNCVRELCIGEQLTQDTFPPLSTVKGKVVQGQKLRRLGHSEGGDMFGARAT